jgi:hypothetical protein
MIVLKHAWPVSLAGDRHCYDGAIREIPPGRDAYFSGCVGDIAGRDALGAA